MAPVDTPARADAPGATSAPAAPLRVGHVVAEYLPRSATFIYTAIRFQHEAETTVLAGHVTNLSEFPISPVLELFSPDESTPRRAARRILARAKGCPTTAEHRIWTSARDARLQLLHAHFGPMGHYSVAASRRLGIPLVTTFYGRDLTVGETDPRWNARYEELFAHGAAFICEGPAMASHLAAVGCPESKIHLARIGLDIAALPFEPSRSRGPLRILQTARFVEKKGIDLSIRALALVREQYADAELLLIGDGPERAKLESLTAELGLDGAVRFLGGASHAEYRQALAQAHMLIQPSRTASDGDTEGGAPTVLIEAQAMGLPVVTTRHADIPFVVADPGRMADEEDVEGIARIVVQTAELSDPEREAAARSARASVEANHDATSIARVHQTIYERALEGASTGSRAAG